MEYALAARHNSRKMPRIFIPIVLNIFILALLLLLLRWLTTTIRDENLKTTILLRVRK